METLCHDPSTSLYGTMLDDYNSSTCVMKEKNTTGGMAHVCSCTEAECNNVLIFSPGESRISRIGGGISNRHRRSESRGRKRLR